MGPGMAHGFFFTKIQPESVTRKLLKTVFDVLKAIVGFDQSQNGKAFLSFHFCLKKRFIKYPKDSTLSKYDLVYDWWFEHEQ